MQRKPKKWGYGAVYPLLEKIKAKLDGSLHVLADSLQSVTKNYGKRKLAVLFSLLLSLYGFCYGYIIYRSFKTGRENYRIEPIHFPVHVAIRDGALLPEKNSGRAAPELKRIMEFKDYMDSLKSSGSPRYDSIQKARPGLLDSLRITEMRYPTLP